MVPSVASLFPLSPSFFSSINHAERHSSPPHNMTSYTNQQPLQAIRSRSANEVIRVATRHDALSGRQIVLWSDIQNVFKDAVSIRKGDVLVSFETDSNFTQ